MDENLIIYEPDEQQLDKFRRINALSDKEWELRCVACDDCSRCDMAIHQFLYSTTKHLCTRGITEEKFRAVMSSADCEY